MRKTFLVCFLIFVFIPPAFSVEEVPPSWLIEEPSTKEVVKEEVQQTTEMPVTPEAIFTKEVEEKIIIQTEEAKVREIVFNDIPEKHWAKSFVYDLVKLGITQGYPDGTFRGDKNISRYESAMFLSRLKESIKYVDKNISEERKMYLERKKQEIEEELKKLKLEVDEIKKPPEERPEFGSIFARLRMGNIISKGSAISSLETIPKFDYRIVSKDLTYNLTDEVSFGFGFDTIDSGWTGGQNRSLLDFIDIYGEVKLSDKIILKASAGPGTKIHIEPINSQIPSDNYIAFIRPKKAVSLVGSLESIYFETTYKKLSVEYTLEATGNAIGILIGQKLTDAPLNLKDIFVSYDYHFDDMTLKSVSKGNIGLVFYPVPQFEIRGILGNSIFYGMHDSSYICLKIKFENLFDEGTSLYFDFNRAGKEYLNYPYYFAEDDYIGVNFFDKLIYSTNEGISDIGFKISRKKDDYRIEVKGDVQMNGEYRYENSSISNSMLEFSFFRLTKMYSEVGFIYRILHIPSQEDNSTFDSMAIVARYNF